jgi:hypothetical protein
MGEWIGNLHPLAVHVPAGVLLLAGLAALLGRRLLGGRALALLFGFGALGAWLSVLSGLRLAEQGSYALGTLTPHKWLGIGTAALASLLALLHLRAEAAYGRWLLPSLNGVLLGALFATGHLGGSMTHGEDYLSEKAPGWFQGLMGYMPPAEAVASLAGSDSAAAYELLIQPLLEQKCLRCHQGREANGGLDMSDTARLRQGGRGGNTLLPGNPGESELFRRVALPASHPRFMPPSGPALSFEQVRLLEWWIASGASFRQPLSALEPGPEVGALLRERYGWSPPSENPLAGLAIPPAPQSALDSLRAAGFLVKPISSESPALEVMPAKSGVALGPAALKALAGLRAQIVWLNLAGAGIGDAELALLGEMPNLLRLRLERNPLGDGGLAALRGMGRLQSLNLYGTKLSNRGLALLEAMPSLREVYAGSTAATAEGARALEAARPGLRVHLEGK